MSCCTNALSSASNGRSRSIAVSDKRLAQTQERRCLLTFQVEWVWSNSELTAYEAGIRAPQIQVLESTGHSELPYLNSWSKCCIHLVGALLAGARMTVLETFLMTRGTSICGFSVCVDGGVYVLVAPLRNAFAAYGQIV